MTAVGVADEIDRTVDAELAEDVARHVCDLPDRGETLEWIALAKSGWVDEDQAPDPGEVGDQRVERVCVDEHGRKEHGSRALTDDPNVNVPETRRHAPSRLLQRVGHVPF